MANIIISGSEKISDTHDGIGSYVINAPEGLVLPVAQGLDNAGRSNVSLPSFTIAMPDAGLTLKAIPGTLGNGGAFPDASGLSAGEWQYALVGASVSPAGKSGSISLSTMMADTGTLTFKITVKDGKGHVQYFEHTTTIKLIRQGEDTDVLAPSTLVSFVGDSHSFTSTRKKVTDHPTIAADQQEINIAVVKQSLEPTATLVTSWDYSVDGGANFETLTLDDGTASNAQLGQATWDTTDASYDVDDITKITVLPRNLLDPNFAATLATAEFQLDSWIAAYEQAVLDNQSVENLALLQDGVDDAQAVVDALIPYLNSVTYRVTVRETLTDNTYTDYQDSWRIGLNVIFDDADRGAPGKHMADVDIITISGSSNWRDNASTVSQFKAVLFIGATEVVGTNYTWYYKDETSLTWTQITNSNVDSLTTVNQTITATTAVLSLTGNSPILGVLGPARAKLRCDITFDDALLIASS